MKEQPQKPERPSHYTAQVNGLSHAVYSYGDATEYFDHLESENQRLQVTVAKLEKEAGVFRIMQHMVERWETMSENERITLHRVLLG